MKPDDLFNACKHKINSINVAGLPEALEISELSVGARMSLTDIDDDALRLATIVKYGVPMLHDIDERELIDRLPFDTMLQISSAVLELSGVGDAGEKKS